MQTKRILIILALVLSATAMSAQNLAEVSKQLSIFNQLYKSLDQYYVDTLNAEKNITTAINSMLDELDPYTEYYPASNTKDLDQMTTGKYAGVGALIHYYKAADRCCIYQLYEDKPAQKAGLKVGDIILSIDGKDMGTKGSMELADYVSNVSSSLRGDPATTARVVVKRPGVADSLAFDVLRASVQLPSVPYYGMVAPGVGMIYLSSFTTDCSQDVLNAMRELKAQGATSLVLDLRGNGGGLAYEAVKIVNLFVPKGRLILKMKGKYEEANTSYATQNNPEDLKIPLVVLVNGNSASASEITCGSLQDLDRAVILGKRTFGKGLVQQPRELPYGGILKLTTSHYYIPSGRCIQALDYSHRTNDGEAYRTPDSLTHVFYTEAGRPVRDGGGITPDVVVNIDTVPTVISYLGASDEYFDYVTKYVNEHPAISSPADFEFIDEDFDQFVDFIAKSGFTPERTSTKVIEQLRNYLKGEDASPESLNKLKELEESLKPDMATILPNHRERLKQVISSDIVERYYYTRGAIENQSKYDKQLKAAIELLNSPERYAKLLKK